MEKSIRKWGKTARLQFIEFRLFWEGRINRGDLVDHFEISIPQASLDLKSYLDLAPSNMDYDKQRKAYFATSGFKPVLTTPNANDYLSQLEMLSAEDGSPFSHRSFVGSPPAFDIAPSPDRIVKAETFRKVLEAIRETLDMEIEYQSMTRPQPMRRWIAPRAIASDGFRWHIRAYCFQDKKFKDFVFGRISMLGSTRVSEVPALNDTEWNTDIELTIGPNPNLDEGRRRGIELDYGMRDGITTLIVREALVQYMKKRLGLTINITGTEAAPQTQQLCLLSERRLPVDDRANSNDGNGKPSPA